MSVKRKVTVPLGGLVMGRLLQRIVNSLLHAHGSTRLPCLLERVLPQLRIGRGYGALIGNSVVGLDNRADLLEQRLERSKQPGAFPRLTTLDCNLTNPCEPQRYSEWASQVA